MMKFTLKLLMVGIISTGAYFLLWKFFPEKFHFDYFPLLALLFIFINLVFHLGLEKSFNKGSKEFVRYYMGGTAMKLFLFLLIIVFYSFINKEHAMAFALAFFFFYVIFTAFEVITSIKQFGKKATSHKPQAASK